MQGELKLGVKWGFFFSFRKFDKKQRKTWFPFQQLLVKKENWNVFN